MIDPEWLQRSLLPRYGSIARVFVDQSRPSWHPRVHAMVKSFCHHSLCHSKKQLVVTLRKSSWLLVHNSVFSDGFHAKTTQQPENHVVAPSRGRGYGPPSEPNQEQARGHQGARPQWERRPHTTRAVVRSEFKCALLVLRQQNPGLVGIAGPAVAADPPGAGGCRHSEGGFQALAFRRQAFIFGE